ncbi:MAG: hypothetical protein A2506_08155 [Elusimicrobia bacterium RIFOXYD12_FULL_66_9]|nr:MAG: hypothetical protein A2506_08155 [Elusimicrobia bacterium RIFOXYD12_FULL_66_9]
MPAVAAEVRRILEDIPKLCFNFPSREAIFQLDAAETTRRRREVEMARQGARDLLATDPSALDDLDDGELQRLVERLSSARRPKVR